MSNWKYEKLSKLCYRIGDGLHGTPEYSESSDVYFINGNNLKNGKIEITENTKKVTSEELLKNFIQLDNNSLLLSINGTLGSMAFFKNEKVMLGKSAAYLNFKTEINKFYYYYFQLPSVQEHFHNVATGSTIKNLSLKSIQDFEVPVPEFNVWKNISKILSSLDAKIEINNRINSELEAMAKTLYDYWFVQFDFPYSPPSEGCPQDGVVFGKPYKSSGGKMVWNAELKREIPEGWEVNELSKVLTIKYGKDHKKLNEGAIPVYGSGGIMRYADKALYNDEAILIPRKGSIGNLFYIAEPFWSVDTMFYTIATAKDSTLYYFYQLSKLNLKTLNVGTAVPSLTTEVLNQIKLLIPDSEVMLKFNSIVSKNKSQILLNLKENQELAALRDWLLPMLMNGQVSVSDVEEELGMVAEPREIYKN